MNNRKILQTAFVALAVVLVTTALLYALYIVSSTILLVILALFFAYSVAPIVDRIERVLLRSRYKIPRPAAIALAYLGLFLTLGLGLYFLLPYLGDQITQLKEQAPGYFQGVRENIQRYNDQYVQRLPPQTRETIRSLTVGKVEEVAGYVTQVVPSLLFGLLHYAPWLFLVPILAFFMLKDASSFRIGLLRMMPRGQARWRANELVTDLNNTLAAYMRAQIIACLLIGSVCTLGFAIIGVPYSVLLGVLAGFFEFIPLIGPASIAVIAALITLVVTGSGKTVGAVLLFLLILRLVHDYVTYPRIIGQGIHLHPLAIILSVLAGAELAGMSGIFLAVPVVATGTVLYRHWLQHRGSAGLMADLFADEPTPEETKSPDPSLIITPDDMTRLRPDLLTGELKKP